MRIHFWGVRGSLPSPVSPAALRRKLATILAGALPEDLADGESRERFLSGLPPWLFGTVGGNTSCVSVELEGFPQGIIFDCGSGMRELGNDADSRKAGYHVFLSHFHWDHLNGLPFFKPAFDPKVSIDFYSPKPDLERILSNLMLEPYSPVSMQQTPSTKAFHRMQAPITLGSGEISFRKMPHPGDSFAYKIKSGGKSFLYATDVEFGPDDFCRNEENAAFFGNLDLAVIDSQYDLLEAERKKGWGHSSYCIAVEFAAAWGIKHLVLFHCDPSALDSDLYRMAGAAARYADFLCGRNLKVSIACEGTDIVL
ncbi:MAG: MBL fold metallo-hydrolase [Treponema sp.]|nr:MBL fold metallo-hydrolase [Treponema sp.]